MLKQLTLTTDYLSRQHKKSNLILCPSICIVDRPTTHVNESILNLSRI